MTALAGWENFYVIVGVVRRCPDWIAVCGYNADCGHADHRRWGAGQQRVCDADHRSFWSRAPAGSDFVCSMERDWHRRGSLGLLGASGIVYEMIVTRRMRAQDAYIPEFEDWLCHVLLPFVAYGVLAASGLAARWNIGAALLAVGGAALLLLFVGIHNAWDTVTYHVFVRRRAHQKAERTPAE
jgi:hypothetical protein